MHPHNQDPLELVRECGGYYEVIKDAEGNRLSPLVGYAGKYEDGEEKKAYVGDVYCNFAKVERHTPTLNSIALILRHELIENHPSIFSEITGFCGAPEGGKGLANALSLACMKQWIYAENQVTALATATAREQKKLIFDRHEPEPGTVWLITEDVANNLSTALEMIELIESFGAFVIGILCFLNRSLKADKTYTVREGLTVPIISMARKKIMQYRQNDPFVQADIQAGNVVWKPKKKEEWALLMQKRAEALLRL